MLSRAPPSLEIFLVLSFLHIRLRLCSPCSAAPSPCRSRPASGGKTERGSRAPSRDIASGQLERRRPFPSPRLLQTVPLPHKNRPGGWDAREQASVFLKRQETAVHKSCPRVAAFSERLLHLIRDRNSLQHNLMCPCGDADAEQRESQPGVQTCR